MTRRTIGVGTFTATVRTKELVLEALASGRISYGPLSRRVEAEVSRLHGRQFGVLSNSGTSSLQGALQALKELRGWQDGDEVIVPSVTFVATVNVVLHNRMVPVLVDVEPDYYGIDPAKIEAAITPRTRAIIPVHLFGMPADMHAISEIAERHSLAVIEDSCETMFATLGSEPVGSFGDAACFSFYVAHLIAAGVGGMAITDDPDLAAVMRSLVNHGRDGIYYSMDHDDGLDSQTLREVVSRRFRFERIGHSFRITELEAALALAQLETWPQMLVRRRANAACLTRWLRGLDLEEHLQLPALRPRATHSWMMYPLVVRREPKAELVNHLESQGIETRDMLPLTTQPAYRRLWDAEDYPVAAWINECGFYIGCHQDLTPNDLSYMVETIKEYFRS